MTITAHFRGGPLIGLRPTTVLTDVPGAREAARERGLGGLDSKGRPV